MTKEEIAMQLTITAIQQDKISSVYNVNTQNDGIEKDNAFYAKQVTDFYNYVLDNMKTI